jgi:hypothetical protein
MTSCSHVRAAAQQHTQFTRRQANLACPGPGLLVARGALPPPLKLSARCKWFSAVRAAFMKAYTMPRHTCSGGGARGKHGFNAFRNQSFSLSGRPETRTDRIVLGTSQVCAYPAPAALDVCKHHLIADLSIQTAPPSLRASRQRSTPPAAPQRLGLLPRRRSTSTEVAAQVAGDPLRVLRDKESAQLGHLSGQASISETPRHKAAERGGRCKLRHSWQPLHRSAQGCRARLEQHLRAAAWRVLAGTRTLVLRRRRLLACEGGASFSLRIGNVTCTRRPSGSQLSAPLKGGAVCCREPRNSAG